MTCEFTPKGYEGKPLSYNEFRQYLLDNPKYWADVAKTYAPEILKINNLTEEDVKQAASFSAKPTTKPTTGSARDIERRNERIKYLEDAIVKIKSRIQREPNSPDIEKFKKALASFEKDLRELNEEGKAAPAGKEFSKMSTDEKIDYLRQQEQDELSSRIKDADKYRGADGRVDPKKLTNKADIDAYNEVYEKYNKQLEPLIQQAKQETSDKSKESKPASDKTKTPPGKTLPQKIADNLRTFAKAIKNAASARNKDAVANVAKALRGIGQKVVVLPTEGFQAAARVYHALNGTKYDERAHGWYFYANGVILVDQDAQAKLEGAMPNVILFHEATHPIINIIRNLDPELYNRVINGLNQYRAKNEDKFNTVEGFLQDYDNPDFSPEQNEARKSDERIVETIAEIGSGNIDISSMPISLKQALIDFINKVLDGILRSDLRLKDTSDEATFRRVATTIALALKEGTNVEKVLSRELGYSVVDRVGAYDTTPNIFGNQQSPQARMSAKRRNAITQSPVYFNNVKDFASQAQNIENKIDFKNQLMKKFEKVLPKLQKAYGDMLDPSKMSDDAKEYIIDAITREAYDAILKHPEAIGWYNEKTKLALEVVSLIHPEIATNDEAKGAFIFALAVTSNGNKVDENFELAEKQYRIYKETGKFDPESNFGAQQAGVRKAFMLVNELLDEGISMNDITNFFTTKIKVGDLKLVNAKGEKKNIIGDELVTEEVFAAAVFGSKIGNGFFMNLWGEYGQLTMDRWFMRTWGRLTGTLIKKDPAKIANNKERYDRAYAEVKNDPVAKAMLGEYLKGKNLVPTDSDKKIGINKETKEALVLSKIFTKKKVRDALNKNGKINELRKAVNNYTKNLFGEVEAPEGGSQRKFIRQVFSEVQKRLKSDYNIDIEMADLQAVLWYPEKILYESFKKGKTYEGIYETYKQEGMPEEISDDITEDDDDIESGPPDYLNASIKLAQKNGISNSEIQRKLATARQSLGLDTGERNTAAGKVNSGLDQRTKEAVSRFYSAKQAPQASRGNRVVNETAVANAGDKLASMLDKTDSVPAALDEFKKTPEFQALSPEDVRMMVDSLDDDDYKEMAASLEEGALAKEKAKTQYKNIPIQASSGSRQLNDTDIVSTTVNVAPLYSVKVNSIEQANSIFASDLYKRHKKEVESFATKLGLKVDGMQDGIGGFAFDDGTEVKEATTMVNVTGNWDDIVNFAAVMGALTPEVQESTIAGRYVEEGSKNHKADEYSVGIDNTSAALRAAEEAGFNSAGFTLLDKEIKFFNVFKYRNKNIREMLATFVNKYKEYGGQITSEGKRAVESEYIDYDRRGAILAAVTGDAVPEGSNWAGVRDLTSNAFTRNKAFAKWKRVNKGLPAKEYSKLRAEQIDAGERGEILSNEKLKRIKDLEDLISEPTARVFASDESRYTEAKAEIEAIANDIAKLASEGFVSEFTIKKPDRAAIKVARWYSLNPNLLGDGSRTNIIVNTDADAKFLFDEIRNRFAQEGDRVEYEMPTKLGYPKRLIEVRTSNGKIAEIQVMTQQGYLAKDGLEWFKGEKEEALGAKSLKEVQERLGWDIPDGVGHYFYEIERDTNVPLPLRQEAIRISNDYYDAFTNPKSTLTDAKFRQEIAAFKEKVDSADKSKWDKTNKGKAPGPLSTYLANQAPQASRGNRTAPGQTQTNQTTTNQPQASSGIRTLPANVRETIRDIIAREKNNPEPALKKIRAILKSVPNLDEDTIDEMVIQYEERIGAKTESEYFFDYVKDQVGLKNLTATQASGLLKQFKNFILSPEDLDAALDFVDRLAKSKNLLDKVNQAKQAFRLLKGSSRNKKLSKADKLFISNLATPKFYLSDEAELINLREMALNFISSRLSNGQQNFTMSEIDAAYNIAAARTPATQRARPATRIRPSGRPVIELAVTDALNQYASQLSVAAELRGMDLSVLDTEVLYQILNALKVYDETGILFDLGQIAEMARAFNNAKVLKGSAIRGIIDKLAIGGISVKLQSIAASANEIRRILVGGWDRNAGRVTTETQNEREVINEKFAELKIGLPERFLLGAYGFLKELSGNQSMSLKAEVLADQMNYLRDRIDNAKKYTSSASELAMLTHYYKGATEALVQLGAIKDENGTWKQNVTIKDQSGNWIDNPNFNIDANVPANVKSAWDFTQEMLQQKTQAYSDALRLYHGRDFTLIQDYWPRSFYKVDVSSGDSPQNQSSQLPQMGNINPTINNQSTDIASRNRGRTLMPREGGFYILDGYETALNGIWDINATTNLSKEYAYTNALVNKGAVVMDSKTNEAVKKYLISSISGILRDPMIFPDTRTFLNKFSDTAVNTITSTILNNFTQFVKQPLATLQGLVVNKDASLNALSLIRQSMSDPQLAQALEKFFNNTSAPYAEQLAYNELESKYFQGDIVSNKARGFLDKISPEWLVKANKFTQKQLLLTGYLAERGVNTDMIQEAVNGFNETALASAENFAEAANSTANRHFLPMEIKDAKAFKKWLYFLSTYTFVATAQFWNNISILNKPGYTESQKKLAALQAVGFLGQQVAFQIATRAMRDLLREIGQAMGWLEEEDKEEEDKNREKYWYQVLGGVTVDTIFGPYMSIVGDTGKMLINESFETWQDYTADTEEEKKEKLNMLYSKQSGLPGAWGVLDPLYKSAKKAINNEDPAEGWAIALQATALMLKLGDVYFLSKMKTRALESVFATADGDKLLKAMRTMDSGQYKDWASEVRAAGVPDKFLSKLTYKVGDMGYYIDASDAKKFMKIYEQYTDQYSKNIKAAAPGLSEKQVKEKAEKVAEKQAQMQTKKIGFKLPENY